MKAEKSASYSLKSRTWALSGSAMRRSEPPCPRQSRMAPANPRAASSAVTSPYFSMNSVWPSKMAQKPPGAAPGTASHVPTRRRLPSALAMNRVRKASDAKDFPSDGFRQNRTELHGKAHVPRYAELALHEGRGRIQFALRKLLEGVEADAD